MKVNTFFNELIDALEIENEEISMETNLINLEEFDSISILAIIALVDSEFDVKLTATQLNSISTVESLMIMIGKDKFEN
jgi:acyl carrier protein